MQGDISPKYTKGDLERKSVILVVDSHYDHLCCLETSFLSTFMGEKKSGSWGEILIESLSVLREKPGNDMVVTLSFSDCH